MNDDQLDYVASDVLDIIWLMETKKRKEALKRLHELEVYLGQLQKVATAKAAKA